MLVVFKTTPEPRRVTVPLFIAPLVMTPVDDIEPPVPSKAIKPPFVVILLAILILAPVPKVVVFEL